MCACGAWAPDTPAGVWSHALGLEVGDACALWAGSASAGRGGVESAVSRPPRVVSGASELTCWGLGVHDFLGVGLRKVGPVAQCAMRLADDGRRMAGWEDDRAVGGRKRGRWGLPPLFMPCLSFWLGPHVVFSWSPPASRVFLFLVFLGPRSWLLYFVL